MIEAEHVCGNHNKNDVEYDRERRGDRLGYDIDKKVAPNTVAVPLKRQNERRQSDGKRAQERHLNRLKRIFEIEKYEQYR